MSGLIWLSPDGVFYTVQGEGKFVGVPSVFVRLSGCNLRCAWRNPDGTETRCDTPYTSFNAVGTKVAWQTVRDQITSFNCEHVVVTGGEPLMQRRGVDLINDLAGSRLVTVETNGTYDRDLDSRVFLSVSPKLTSAGASPIVPAMILKHEYQLKFVVNTEADIAEIDQLVDKHTVPASNVYLMPQGTEPSQFDSRLPWIVDLAKARGYRVSDRLHIRIWGSRRGV